MSSLLKCETAIIYFARTNPVFKAVELILTDVREAVKVLENPYAVTKLLQRPKCTLSDFFGATIIMKEKLNLWEKKAIQKTNLAKCLIKQYKTRKRHLFYNEAMASAVFLDRRYSSKQKTESTAIAKISLCKLWERVRSKRMTNEGNHMEHNTEGSLDNSINFDDFDFEYFCVTPFKNLTNTTITSSPIPINEQRVQSREVDFRKN